MKRHDLPGYLAVLKFRESKTILVEGRSDKAVIDRALREFERDRRVPNGSVAVDSVDDIDCACVPPGNRARVQKVLAEARAAGFEVFGFVDREFEQFTASADEFRDDLACHHQPLRELFWTRGHSIENYFFESEYVQEFLRYRFSDRIPTSLIDQIPRYWPSALANVAALSVAARNAGLLTRLGGGFALDTWEVRQPETVFIVPGALEALAVVRGLAPQDAADFRADFERLLPAATRVVDAGCPRWVTHGHLGDEALWFAAGCVLAHLGAAREVAREVGSGYREDKRLHRADRWAQLHRNAPAPHSPTPLWEAVGIRQG